MLYVKILLQDLELFESSTESGEHNKKKKFWLNFEYILNIVLEYRFKKLVYIIKTNDSRIHLTHIYIKKAQNKIFYIKKKAQKKKKKNKIK